MNSGNKISILGAGMIATALGGCQLDIHVKDERGTSEKRSKHSEDQDDKNEGGNEEAINELEKAHREMLKVAVKSIADNNTCAPGSGCDLLRKNDGLSATNRGLVEQNGRLESQVEQQIRSLRYLEGNIDGLKQALTMALADKERLMKELEECRRNCKERCEDEDETPNGQQRRRIKIQIKEKEQEIGIIEEMMKAPAAIVKIRSGETGRPEEGRFRPLSDCGKETCEKL